MNATVLERSDISTDGLWVPLSPKGISFSEYRDLVGSSVDSPAGVAVVLARRAFTRDLPLPPGGVLLGVDTTIHQPVTDLDLQFRCSISEALDSRGRVLLSVDVELRPDSGEVVGQVCAEVKFLIRWPEET